MGTLDGTDNDPAIAAAVHNAAKNVVFSITRTNAMNMGNATVVSVTPLWRIALYAATGVCALLAVGSAFIVVRTKKKQKQEK